MGHSTVNPFRTSGANIRKPKAVKTIQTIIDTMLVQRAPTNVLRLLDAFATLGHFEGGGLLLRELRVQIASPSDNIQILRGGELGLLPPSCVFNVKLRDTAWPAFHVCISRSPTYSYSAPQQTQYLKSHAPSQHASKLVTATAYAVANKADHPLYGS